MASPPQYGSLDFDRERWLNEYDPRFGDYDPRPDDELARRLAIDPATADAPSVLPYLERFRRRIVYAAIAVAIGVSISFLFISEIVEFIMRPLQQMLPFGQSLIYTDPSEAFLLYIKIGLVTGVMLASPIALLQLWLAIAPPSRSHATRWAVAFLVMSSILFVLGSAFSHFVVFPMTWRFFVGFSTGAVEFRPRIEPAFAMYLWMLVTFGTLFQMPALVLLLARMRMITAAFLMRNFQYAVLLMVIAAAVITPDGGGLTLIAIVGPMMLLYGTSIVVAWAFAPRPAGC